MMRFLLVFPFLFLTISNAFAQTTNLCQWRQCLAVVDAGSTGSRLHVYAYEMDKTNTPIHIKEIWTRKVKPGFANIDPNYSDIQQYLYTLLSDAPVQRIPLYFYATAGMRLFPSSKQKLYYQGLQQWFSQQNQWNLLEAKTITGNEEATYAWLSVNYHLDKLKSQPVGVMDMGGASVQIVFPININNPINNSSTIKFNLYGQSIYLYVHSFLGLGMNEMSHQFLNSPSCFANGYPLPDNEAGQGDALSCEQEVSSLINSVHKVNQTVQPVLINYPVHSWYAIGGLANLTESALFHFENNQLINQELLQQADNQICHQSWDSLNSQFPNNDYLFGYCLFSAYYYALMVDGYGISPDQTVNYLPSTQNLDWTKGVVLLRPH